MVKSAYIKDVVRNATRRPGRFLLLLIVSAMGAAFYVGIKAAAFDMRLTADAYYKEQYLYDLRVQGAFFEEPEMPESAEAFELSYTADAFALDKEGDRHLIRFHALPDSVNQLVLLRGQLPQTASEMVCEEKFMNRLGMEIGDTVTIENTSPDELLPYDGFTITGTINSPLYINQERGSSVWGDGHIECYAYLQKDSFAYPYYTDLYITVRGSDSADQLSDEYVQILNSAKEDLDTVLNGSGYLATRMENAAYNSFARDADRLEAIGDIFPLIFYLVAALVALTSMTRMVEEHRLLIGLYKALGYPRYVVGMKYLLYALLAAGPGSVLGFSFGQVFFPRVIWGAYSALYGIPGLVVPHHFEITSIAAAMSIGALLLVTALTVAGTLRRRPAALMRPRPPANGRRILLERVRFIWKHLSFSYKMTARNLFRYKKRLLMTIIGIMGCTALLMTGFGIRDSIGNIAKEQFGRIFSYDVQGVVAESPGEYEKMERMIFDGTDIESLVWGRLETVYLTTQQNSVAEEASLLTLSSPGTSLFSLQDRKGKLTLGDEGVLLTEKLAGRIGVSTGGSITLRDVSNRTFTARVAGICENYIGNYCYITPALYRSLTGEEPVWNTFFANAGDAVSHQLLELPFILRVSLSKKVEESISDMVDVLDIVVVVLVLSAAALALVVLLSLTSITITERERELATLKVLGFMPGELAMYIYRENIILTLMGIAAGLAGGFFMHRYIITTIEVDMVSFARNIHPLSYLYSAVLTIIFAVIVNLFMSIRLSRIDMVSSLKSVE